MDILSILQLLGGIGLFLYGMNLMGSSLEKLAGSGLEQILEKLTTSKKKGVAFIKGRDLVPVLLLLFKVPLPLPLC